MYWIKGHPCYCSSLGYSVSLLYRSFLVEKQICPTSTDLDSVNNHIITGTVVLFDNSLKVQMYRQHFSILVQMYRQHFSILRPVTKFRCSAWLHAPLAGPALWNYPAPPYSRRINTIRQKGSAWRVLPTFEYKLFLFTQVDLAIG